MFKSKLSKIQLSQGFVEEHVNLDFAMGNMSDRK